MRRHIKSNFVQFNDGFGTSYKVSERALTEIRQEVIHFSNGTVGERRFWDAYVAGVTISGAIKVPYDSIVNQGDVFVIDGNQFYVSQKDLKTEGLSTYWLLSLTDSPIIYRNEVQ